MGSFPRAMAPAVRPPRGGGSETPSYRTAIEESLGLFLVGGVCCVLGVYYVTTGARFGESRLPVWELFVALGIVGLVGGFLSLAADDDIAPPTVRPLGRPLPHVVLPVEGGRELREETGRTDVSEVDEREGEALGRMPENAPVIPEGGDESSPVRGSYPTTVEDALAELDGLERSLNDGPRIRSGEAPFQGRSTAPTLTGVPAGGRASQPFHQSGERSRATSRLPPEDDPSGCGGCGRLEIGEDGEVCPGCGAVLCASCWAGLQPPPCPGCAVLRRNP